MEKVYYSTRDKALTCDDVYAILHGLADNGGLYVASGPFPTMPLDNVMKMDYHTLCTEILGAFLPSFDIETRKSCVHGAYDDGFDDERLTPVKKVGKDYILELFHGPTSAFKDMALCMLPRLMSAAIDMREVTENVMILTATSGDTGKAAMNGFQDVNHTAITIFYPADGVSEVQRKQMTTQEGSNVQVFALAGNFDDAQSKVKKLFQDESMKAALKPYNFVLSSANSINIGRLVPQIVYYFDAYRQLVEAREITLHEEVCFSVPTGNFGDILAGFYAKQMGLPIHKLICCVNANNVLYDFFTTGVYDRNRPFFKTTSPSMDILISSNLERFIFELSGRDDTLIRSLMDQLQKEGHFTVPPTILKRMQEIIFVNDTQDEEGMAMIDHVFKQHHYVMDPHTAVAWHGKTKYHELDAEHKVIVLATASPYKFPKTVLEALGCPVPENDWDCMRILEAKTKTTAPIALMELETKEERFHKTLSKETMKEAIFEFAKKSL